MCTYLYKGYLGDLEPNQSKTSLVNRFEKWKALLEHVVGNAFTRTCIGSTQL